MTSPRPPAQPKSILRGHKAQVHSTTFLRSSQRLASGDADGFVVLWDLTIMRPRVVWRPHQGAILGIAGWGDDKIITHGRDNRLVVWKLGADDEATLSTTLPLDQSESERPQPWILHILEVNTMNFCAFASCPAGPAGPGSISDALLVAVPNTLSTESVDIYHLPSQTRRYTVQFASKAAKIGMAMALSLLWLGDSLTLVAGFENGHAMVAQMRSTRSWDVVYKAQTHSQPILSLDVAPDSTYFLTSGADAIIAKHPIPSRNASLSAQGKSTAGNVRPSPPETDGGNTAAPVAATASPPPSGTHTSLLSAALAAKPSNDSSAAPTASTKRAAPPQGKEAAEPIRTVNTKHAGLQGLRVRLTDGKVFATAGWDGRVRVYSTRTLAELAVLRWHDVGCYTVAFADVNVGEGAAQDGHTAGIGPEERGKGQREGGDRQDEVSEQSAIMSRTPGAELSVRDRRIKMAKEAHWLAAGSKDGRISLWDIY